MAVTGKQVSMGEIMWRVMNNPIATELTFDQAAEYALEFIKLMNAPLTLSDNVKKIEIQDYKGYLPQNIVDIKGIKWLGEDGCSLPHAMRYATDIYHVQQEDNEPKDCYDEYTYIVQNCVIQTNRKKGFIDIAYKELPIDEDGFPLIPDNESFKQGLYYYILCKYLEILWTMGKITDKVFDYYQQQRYFYFGQAENSVKIRGIDHLESIMNSVNRIIVSTTLHDKFYQSMGQKERIKKFN